MSTSCKHQLHLNWFFITLNTWNFEVVNTAICKYKTTLDSSWIFNPWNFVFKAEVATGWCSLGYKEVEVGINEERRGGGLKIGDRVLKMGEWVLKMGEGVFNMGERVLKMRKRVLKMGDRVLKMEGGVLKMGERVSKIGERGVED